MADELEKPAANERAVGAAAPVGDPDRRQYLEHLKKVNDVFYDQIKMADQKAAYIFTFILAFLVTSSEGRSAYRLERYQSGDALLIILSLLLGLAAVVCVVAAILVVLPRHRGGKASSLYWGAWSANRDEFVAAEQRADANYLRDEYLNNIDNLSAINRSKYRAVSVAFRALIVVVVSYVLLLAYGAGATALAR